jgi:hypothetical protein
MDTDAARCAATDGRGFFVINVISAHAGIQAITTGVDSRVRGNDGKISVSIPLPRSGIRVHPCSHDPDGAGAHEAPKQNGRPEGRPFVNLPESAAQSTSSTE